MKATIVFFSRISCKSVRWFACVAKSRCQESKDKIFSKKCEESTVQVMVSACLFFAVGDIADKKSCVAKKRAILKGQSHQILHFILESINLNPYFM
jgi:hypothetical protein